MSKVTFRADDELIELLEEKENSKSDIIREALESYLNGYDKTRELETLYEGFEKYFSGLLSESPKLVEEGGEILTEYDAHLGNRAAHFYQRFERMYWED